MKRLINCLPLLIASIALSTWVTAQVDINQMMQDHMQKQGGGIQVQDDNDPYVPNAYIGSFRMEVHTYNGDKEDKHSPMDLLFWSAEDKTLFETSSPGMKQSMRMLIDHKGKWQYMLMTDEKGQKMAMKTRKMKVKMDEEEAKNVPDFQMTDETKMIDGHLCHKAISKSEDGTWIGWMAKDIDAPFADMIRQAGRQGESSRSKQLTGIHGFPLEYEWVDKNGKDRVVCFVKDVVVGPVDESIFSIDDYELMEIPAMPYGR